MGFMLSGFAYVYIYSIYSICVVLYLLSFGASTKLCVCVCVHACVRACVRVCVLCRCMEDRKE